jgi:sulfate permease, SulP family
MNVRGVWAAILEKAAAAQPRPTVVLLDMGGTADTSVTVIDVFAETNQQLAREGVELWVATVPTRALEKVEGLPAWQDLVARDRVHPSTAAAVAAFESGRPAGDG